MAELLEHPTVLEALGATPRFVDFGSGGGRCLWRAWVQHGQRRLVWQRIPDFSC